MKIAGNWRIVEMELWATEDIDLLGPAFINFARDGTGSFRFIAVEGWMDCRDAPRDGRPGAEFTWDGNDEGSPTSGHGWVVLDDGALVGRIYIHLGDDSAFRAVRAGRTAEV
ncbi:MAG TPA: hypothetical protein VFA94_00185 [Acidimicrobiales bacterium]|nr:hypothetical protein [Acidimicrobiales bacterium]